MTAKEDENNDFSPRRLRKADPTGRRDILDALVARVESDLPAQARRLDEARGDQLEFASVMVENAWGFMDIPLGVVPALKVDGHEYVVPLATEEPSVIAAASYAAGLVNLQGGFETSADEPVMKGTVYLQFSPQEGQARETGTATTAGTHEPVCLPVSALPAALDNLATGSPPATTVSPALPRAVSAALAALEAARPELSALLDQGLASMTARGGGLRGLGFSQLAEKPDTLKVEFLADVRDALGANLINTCAESLRQPLQRISGGTVLMAILSNHADHRLCRAGFRLPVGELKSGAWSGLALARRICEAGQVAQADPDRAVTHNKGIMNGISALALATGNDTRALEAAVHAWASRSGRCRGLSTYTVEDGFLVGRLEAPMPLGVVGGASGCHPMARYNLALLGKPGASELGRIACALGLAQNLAALMALAGEGIQPGHMRLHQRRLEWMKNTNSGTTKDEA